MRQVHTSRLDRIPEPLPSASLDLHERHEAVTLNHEIDIPVPAPEPALHDPPALPPEPPLGDPLSQLTKCLPGR